MWRKSASLAIASAWRQRAQPLLGTVVIVRIVCREQNGRSGIEAGCDAAFEAAFAAVRHVSAVMSAHHPGSDLGRIARGRPGSVLELDPHTVQVLRLARYWHVLSRGAFDPVRAARQLHRRGCRPGFAGAQVVDAAALRDITECSPTEILLEKPVLIDLGGLAKGYAVDQAVAALRAHGVTDALVNAGGDMRAIGDLAWPIAFRHAQHATHTRRMRHMSHLHNAALASSAADVGSDFVPTLRRRDSARWSSCSALAADCASADALTKWGLQSSEQAPALRRALRAHHAQLWRSL